MSSDREIGKKDDLFHSQCLDSARGAQEEATNNSYYNRVVVISGS